MITGGFSVVLVRDYLPKRVGGYGGMVLLLVGMLLAVPFLVTALALDRFLVWFQRFRPHMVWVDRIAGAMLIVLGILLVTDNFTVLAGYLQGLTPDALRRRL